MKMYHPKTKNVIDVHPSQIKTAENRGWTQEQPKKSVKQSGVKKDGKS